MIMMKILKGVHIIAAPAGWQVTTRDIRVLKKKRFSNTRSVPGVVAGNATWQNTNTHTIATYLQITHYSKRD